MAGGAAASHRCLILGRGLYWELTGYRSIRVAVPNQTLHRIAKAPGEISVMFL